jgi:pimeloyl-ACP methyl ester carboxylesterase
VLTPRPALAALSAAGRSTRRGVRTVCNPAGLRGAGTELAWITAHLALYPLGMGTDKARGVHREEQARFSLGDLPPVQRGLLIGDVVAAGTPILLVHGLVDNRSIFTLLRRTLRRRGFGRVITLNYSPLTQDVRSVATRLAALIEKTCEETGYERVHVIGHSLGGVVARYYVQRLGGDSRVHTLCTLGTPHSGTHAAKLWPGGVVRQLRPGSDLMRELAEPAPGCRTRFVAFWSDMDQLIVPQRAAAIDHPDLQARNVALRGVGHMSLPISGDVVHEIATLLAHLDEDGRAQTAGVTTLTLPGAGPAAAKPVAAQLARSSAPA